jgi:hypothetical protein
VQAAAGWKLCSSVSSILLIVSKPDPKHGARQDPCYPNASVIGAAKMDRGAPGNGRKSAGGPVVGKTFTLSEAQNLLPLVESLLEKAQEAGRRAAELEGEMQRLSHRIFLSGGMHVNVAAAARKRAEREKALKEAQDTLAEIDEIGVQVKDLSQGLLDFPCVLDGETVLLCWKQGEKEIGWWHTTQDGFAGRRPLDSRFGRNEKERLN